MTLITKTRAKQLHKKIMTFRKLISLNTGYNREITITIVHGSKNDIVKGGGSERAG